MGTEYGLFAVESKQYIWLGKKSWNDGPRHFQMAGEVIADFIANQDNLGELQLVNEHHEFAEDRENWSCMAGWCWPLDEAEGVPREEWWPRPWDIKPKGPGEEVY